MCVLYSVVRTTTKGTVVFTVFWINEANWINWLDCLWIFVLFCSFYYSNYAIVFTDLCPYYQSQQLDVKFPNFMWRCILLLFTFKLNYKLKKWSLPRQFQARFMFPLSDTKGWNIFTFRPYWGTKVYLIVTLYRHIHSQHTITVHFF